MNIDIQTTALHLHLLGAQTYFQNFEGIAIHLRTTGLLIDDVCFILDQICKYCPSMTKYLSKKSDIVHGKLFQVGFIKIVNRKERNLQRAEKGL